MVSRFVGEFAGLVLVLTAVTFAFTGSLIVLAVARRRYREEHFKRLDDARKHYRPIITELLKEGTGYEQVLSTLQAIAGKQRMYILERLCLENMPTPGQVPTIRRLCEDLGLVDLWQRQVANTFRTPTGRSPSAGGDLLERTGRLSFVISAQSAENLRFIQHQPSWPLLVKSLEAPHPDVQAVAARALAAIAEPQSVPALVQCLHRAVFIPSAVLSVRSIKDALVRFPLEFARDLLPSLSHAHPRIRFLATDIIREMVEHAAKSEAGLDAEVFPAALTEVFLNKLCRDVNPDVRARAAPVIGSFTDPRARPALLALLDDSQWFVRLHAVRALAHPKYISESACIAHRTTDPNWRVREAAVKTLAALGEFGLLLDHLIWSDDRYAREQIAEELERNGFMSKLLVQYSGDTGLREKRAVEQLARLGKVSYIIAFLQNGAPPRLREKFLLEFGLDADPRVRAWAQQIARA